MRLTHLGLLALASKVTHGFVDTSPFFMFSTTELLLPTDQLQSGSKLTSELISTFSRCPSDIYVLINQPGVGVSDFSTPTSAPTLSKFLNRAAHPILRSSVIIPEVAGSVDVQLLGQELDGKCGTWSTAIDAAATATITLLDKTPQVLSIDFPSPSTSQPERAEDILDHDRSISSVLDLLSNRNYTVIYTTTPQVFGVNRQETSKQYEMYNHDQSLHTDLKRDITPQPLRSKSNQTLVDGPLFEKYQFLSPGLFMGLSVSFLLLSILYVAVSGVASLQVTYAAFDKENGPAAQKKAQ